MISQFIWESLKLLAVAQYTLIRFYFQSRVPTNPSKTRDPPHLKSREKTVRKGIFFLLLLRLVRVDKCVTIVLV